MEVDRYQVEMAKCLINVLVMHCLRFDAQVVAIALRQKADELEQEATVR